MKEWKEEAGTTRKSNGPRMFMELYQQESDDYWGYYSNRYLATSKNITLNQCVNVCRSKQVYEALLFKNGKTTSWHKEAKIIYHADHAIKSRPLLQFAHDTFGFPIGDLHYEDKSG